MNAKIIFILVLIVSVTCKGSESLNVELYDQAGTIKLSWDQKLHLYENTIGYLSTCHYLDRVIGQEITVLKENQSLQNITAGSYLKLGFGNQKPRFPISNTVQEVDKIYVGIRSNGFPDIITENNDQIQLYAKCQGHYAVLNYSCDPVLSSLLGFKIDSELCERLK